MRLSNISNEYKAIKNQSQILFLESFKGVFNLFILSEFIVTVIILDDLQGAGFDDATKSVAHPDLGYGNARILRKEIEQMLDLYMLEGVGASGATASALGGFVGGGGGNVVFHNADN